MIRQVVRGTDGKDYPIKHIEQVLKIMRKHDGLIIDPQTVEMMNLTISDVVPIADKLGMKIRAAPIRTTRLFCEAEIQDLLPLIMEGNNRIAWLRLAELCMPLFVRSWQDNKNLDYLESQNDRYWQYLSVCYIILDDYLRNYWKKKQEGGYTPKPGYTKPVAFTVVLRKRLLDAARIIRRYSNVISIGEGMQRRADEVKRFIRKYEEENDGAFPSIDEIGDACHIVKPKVVQSYLNYLNIRIISGNDIEKSYHSNNGSDTLEQVFSFVEDTTANFSSGERFDQFAIRETVRRLGKVRCCIIFLRFGIQCDVHTDAEIRDMLGLSKKEYNKLLNSAMEELKENLSDYKIISG